jgi:hypothetical protein
LHLPSYSIPGCTQIWKTWAPLRVKIFLWLVVWKRHWTANRKNCHRLDARNECYLCDQDPETIDHIITTCSFFQTHLVVHSDVLGADAAQVGGGGPHRRLVGAVEKRWHRGKRKGADTLFALVAWELWKERNTRLFWNEVATSVQLATIKQIADLWIEAGARHLGELVRE